MATTMYFEKEIKDQDKENSLFVEFGRSSYYAGCRLEDGSEGQDRHLPKCEWKWCINGRGDCS